jgi:hypothetical protein
MARRIFRHGLALPDGRPTKLENGDFLLIGRTEEAVSWVRFSRNGEPLDFSDGFAKYAKLYFSALPEQENIANLVAATCGCELDYCGAMDDGTERYQIIISH